MGTALANVDAEVREVMDGMNEDLLKIYEEMRKIDAKSLQSDIASNYHRGQLAEKASDVAKYGDSAVKRLAIALGKNYSDLKGAQRVATIWSREEVDAFVQRQMPAGRTLSFTHLMLLTAVQGTGERKKLTSKMFAEGLTTVDLAAEIQKAVGGKRGYGGRKPLAPRTPRAGVNQLVKMTETLLGKQPGLEKAVFDVLDEAAAEEWSTELTDELATAEESCQSLIGFGQLASKRLHTARERGLKLLAKRTEAEKAEKKANPPEKKSPRKKAGKASRNGHGKNPFTPIAGTKKKGARRGKPVKGKKRRRPAMA